MPETQKTDASVFRDFCNTDVARPPQILPRLADRAGNSLDGLQARVILALSLLMHREPRECCYPRADAGAIGDVIEAILGLCYPYKPRDMAARDMLGQRLGLDDRHYRSLHASLETLITCIANLVAVAHHHPLAEDCPRSWKELEDSGFPLLPTFRVFDWMIRGADLTALHEADCAVCLLYQDVLGTDAGPAPVPPESSGQVEWVVRGYTLGGPGRGALPRPSQVPGVTLTPPGSTTGTPGGKTTTVTFVSSAGKDH